MISLNDENRELLLSMYLDGELSPEERRAVEDKIRTDEGWKAEYALMSESETSISRVVEGNWHDEAFTEKVRTRIQTLPVPTRASQMRQQAPAAEAPPTRGHWRWLTGVLAAALVVAGACFLALRGGSVAPPLPDSAAVATFDPAGVSVVASSGAPALKPGRIFAGQTLTVEAARARLRLAQGGAVWLAQGGTLKVDARGDLKLAAGAALVSTAERRRSLEIAFAGGATSTDAEAQWEMLCAAEGTGVRALAGQVEFFLETASDAAAKKGAGWLKTLRAGQELRADGSVRFFDPREIGARWGSLVGSSEEAAALRFAPPWPQLSGSAGHTGCTPYAGPSVLGIGRFIPLPAAARLARAGPEARVAAVMDARETLYLLCPAPDDTVQLHRITLNSPNAEWEACGEAIAGGATQPPVITPNGLVVAATKGRMVQAWDPAGGKVAWRRDLDSAVQALCVTPDGLILCSTFQRVVALRESGEQAWVFGEFTDFLAPACVRADGSILLVSRAGKLAFRDAEGKAKANSGAVGIDDLRWPPVAAPDGGVWLSSGTGNVAKIGADNRPADPGAVASGLTAWPLANGVLAAGGSLLFPCGVKVRLPVDGDITALAADGAGCVYAGVADKVYRVSTYRSGVPLRSVGDMPFGAVREGIVVRAGIAVDDRRLIVTTTRGVHVFE